MDFEKKILSVTDINNIVKDVIENTFMPFYVGAEIGSLLIHRSGHVYLTLKDAHSQLKATYFGGAKIFQEMNLQNGDKVEVFGVLSVYAPRGEYQLNIRRIVPLGIGAMQQKFEEVKRKLQAEGLFDEARKKAIPPLPKTIGVITSPTGAAIRDFMQVLSRRFPDCHVKIYPAQVQGDTASLEVAQGVAFFNRTNSVDVIVITRGGGSMEDLFPFNSENLARMIAASKIPIISAVGHEIDFTICDFVADLRVPTPSAAAELVIRSRAEIDDELLSFQKSLKNKMQLNLSILQRQLEQLASAKIFKNIQLVYENYSQSLDEKQLRLNSAMAFRKDKFSADLELLAQHLNSLNPQLQLSRGYAIILDDNNRIVKSSNQKSGDKLLVKFADGDLKVCVE